MKISNWSILGYMIGSAFSLFSGYKNIIQPTGKVINIRIKKDKIFVSAEVKEVLK